MKKLIPIASELSFQRLSRAKSRGKLESIFTVTLVLALISANSVRAQEQEGYVKDLMEVNFFGGGGVPSGDIKEFSDTVGAKFGYDFGFDAGFFITQSWVAGLNFTYTAFKIDDVAKVPGLHHKLYSPNLYLKYYFTGQSDFVPYLKAQGGPVFPKFTTLVGSVGSKRYREMSYDPVFAYGFGAGLFYFTTDFSGLFVEANYLRAESSGSKVNYQGVDYSLGSDLNLIDIHAGVRILIGGSSE